MSSCSEGLCEPTLKGLESESRDGNGGKYSPVAPAAALTLGSSSGAGCRIS